MNSRSIDADLLILLFRALTRYQISLGTYLPDTKHDLVIKQTTNWEMIIIIPEDARLGVRHPSLLSNIHNPPCGKKQQRMRLMLFKYQAIMLFDK